MIVTTNPMKPAMFLALVVVTRLAYASPPLFDADFGPAEAGLQLAVTVDAGGTTATFKVKNGGTKSVTFVEKYSCSGLSPWSISAGASDKALDRNYGYEPAVKGLTTQLKTTCTRNGPIKQSTVAQGATVAITVPFATAGEITKSTDKVFEGNAVVSIDGRQDLVLHSAPALR